MSRLFSNLQRLERTTALITAYPFTISCWVYDDGTSTVFPFLVGCSTSGTTVNTTRLQLYIDNTGKINAGVGAVAAVTTTTRATNTWFHACAVYTNATSRAAFLNGAGKGTNATSATVPTGMNRTSINAWNAGANVGIAGNIAHVAIWNVALTDQEVLSLANGLSPLRCRPQSLIDYWPLAASYTDETGVRGNVMTNYSSVAGSIEPNVSRPELPRIIIPAPTVRPRTTGESFILTEAILKGRRRSRLVGESFSLLDFVLETSVRGRVSSDDVTDISDFFLREMQLTRDASEEILALDAALLSIFRNRTSTDSSDLIDEFVATVTTGGPSGPTIYAFTATETLTLIDLAIKELSLSRVSSDALVAEDALILSALRSRILSESASATDETLRRVSLNRVLLDAAILVDDSITSARRNRASSESLSVLDEALTARQSSRTASESLDIAEVVARSISRAIFTSDLLTVADATLLVKQITAQVSEELSISEIIAKSVILSAYFDVRVLLGTLMRSNETVLGSAKDISVSVEEIATLGSSESILLSASDSPTLGSYS